ncbi:hypothetical protein [Flagellimonas pacifica]|uniref:Conjugal transfer protein TraI n=1 Tax=Flagellimonas pacifica TaxID=1247520 RepID=A0A285MZU8_9FLAO|nr:hypothetical protein [Allomuricauda parva]SNZ01306.1 hypothetical protein SAMN06265377_3144 [Allomuricauda parva]
MKTRLLILVLLSPILVTAQIPVTDAATNASVGMVNSQLTSINLQLKAVNKNLSRLINLMEKNNNNNRKSKEILKEELDAKKKAPDYVIKSTDVNMTISLKDKILKAYRTSSNTVQELEYLERGETQEFVGYASQAILETNKLFKQCNDILKTKSIILPEERLKKVDGINIKLNEILDDLIAYNDRLSKLNAFRKARRTLINMNKD